MLFLYNLFIFLYFVVIRVAARCGNGKAKQWVDGRKSVFENLKNKIAPGDKVIWVHCASAGEFEQGKPIIIKLSETYPAHKILITFFSPSGFRAAKKHWAEYRHATVYLPLDTKKNAEKFISIAKPELAIFVKYEFWYHHLKTIYDKKIPLLLASAIFRNEQLFFKPYGGFYRNMLRFFHWIFVQDEASVRLLKMHNITRCSTGGDTRFDRVAAIAAEATGVYFVDEFAKNSNVIVAGSTWPGDEALLAQLIKEYENVKLIIAPHEINDPHIRQLKKFFSEAVLYSDTEKIKQMNEYKTKEGGIATTSNDKKERERWDTYTWDTYTTKQILIVDAFGLLSQLYRYATITYVGGGFNRSGIHNTLEAAVWGKPVVFGPNYHKFKEARELVAAKGAFSINNGSDLKTVVEKLLNDASFLQQSSEAAKNYVQQNRGATEKIMQYVQENRLLTR